MGSTEPVKDAVGEASSRAGGVALLVLTSVLWSLSGLFVKTVLNPVWVWMGAGEVPDVATVVGGMAILLAMGLEATASDVR